MEGLPMSLPPVRVADVDNTPPPDDLLFPVAEPASVFTRDVVDVEVGDGPNQLSLQLDRAISILPADPGPKVFKKAVQAVHCHPVGGEQTVVTRRVFSALVVHAQEVFGRLHARDRMLIKQLRGAPLFKVSIRRLRSLIEHSGGDYQRIYDAIESLYQWEMKWNLMSDVAADATIVGQFKSRIISTYGIGSGPEQGVISYEFPPDTLMMLLEPHPYARIEMAIENRLGSQYAIGLYENTVRYIGSPAKLTAVLPVAEWTALLAGEGKYEKNYGDFKRYVLKPSMAMLAQLDVCPYTLELRELLGPRNRVTALQFKLNLKAQASLGLEFPPPTWHPSIVETLQKVFGKQPHEIGQLAKARSEAEIVEAINRTRVQMQRKAQRGETIFHMDTYLDGILANMDKGAPRDQEPVLEEGPAEVARKEVQIAAKKVDGQRQEFEHFRMVRLETRLAELPRPELEELQQAFTASEGEKAVNKSWLAKGWEKRNGPLHAIFRSWLIQARPELVERLLPGVEERDFAVWQAMRTPT